MMKCMPALASIAAIALLHGTAGAQGNWPTKPVHVIVNAAAGSGADTSARLFSERLSKKFGQPFVLDFKPGANGIVGTEAAARAPKDGYTLLYTYSAAHVVNPALYPKLSYDPVRDFTGVAQIGAGGNLLVVAPNLPVNNLAEFIAYVKSKPADALSYGSWGSGSGGHISMEALKQQAGVQIKHIPYKSAPASLMDVMNGVLDTAFTSVPGGLPLVMSGKLKAIAVSGPYRVPQLPDVKTMSEQGVNFDIAAYYAFVAPAGTPKAIIDQLNQEINQVLTSPDTVERLTAMGFSKLPVKSPEEFDETIKNDLKVWGEIVRKGNIQID
jgi:tripartite-type tricarboxylate transporter receptor subunit TctC